MPLAARRDAPTAPDGPGSRRCGPTRRGRWSRSTTTARSRRSSPRPAGRRAGRRCARGADGAGRSGSGGSRWSPAVPPTSRSRCPGSPTCPGSSCSGSTGCSAGRRGRLTAAGRGAGPGRAAPAGARRCCAAEGADLEDKGLSLVVHARRCPDPAGAQERLQRAAGRARRRRTGSRCTPAGRARAAPARLRQARRAAVAGRPAAVGGAVRRRRPRRPAGLRRRRASCARAASRA